MSDQGFWPNQGAAAQGQPPDSTPGAQRRDQEPTAPNYPTAEQTMPNYPAPEQTLPNYPSATQAMAGYPSSGPTMPSYPPGPGPTASYPSAGPTSPAWPSVTPQPGGHAQAPYVPPPASGFSGPQPPDVRPSAAPHGKALRSAAGVLMIVAAAAAGAGIGRIAWPNSSGSSSASPRVSSPANTPGSTGSGSQGSLAPSSSAAIAAKVDPALVDVNVAFTYQNSEGAGTGIVISPNGLVLTNNHVIDEATNVKVTDLGNGRTYAATVLGYDNVHDVALLQLHDASGLTTATVSSTPARYGEPVVAIGNAGGVGGTPSVAPGTVTGVNQSITASDELTESTENLTGMIETDCDIQQGDSGGPLVNSSGEVLGMDTAASESFEFSQTGTQGFSIPISRALQIAKTIEAGRGTATVHVGATAFIGLRLYEPNSSNTFQLPGSSTSTPTNSNGLEVYQAVSGTPAAKVGITEGDVLTKFNGTTLSSDSELSHLLVRYHPGDKVKVGWVTPGGQDESATITLASGPPS